MERLTVHKVDIPAKSLFRIVVAVALVFLFTRLAPFLITFFLSILLAVTMSAAADWLRDRGLKKGLAQVLVAIALIGAFAFTIGILIPTIFHQISNLAERLPQIKADIEKAQLSERFRSYLHPFLQNPEKWTGDVGARLASGVTFAFGGLYEVLLILILAIYLMFDGELAHDWLLAFFSYENQRKIRQTTREIRPIVFAYVTGQAITSLIVAVYVFVLLQFVLHVPAAVTLATIAAICDIIPVVGFIMSVAAGAVMGLTVSPGTALAVIVVYLAYMALENYFVAPKVYGKSMNLSKLAVLLSILIGGEVAGVPGMILALPLVASYPVIEKIWLHRYVGQETIEEHQRQGVE